MNQFFNPECKTISEIFGGDKIYSVPNFQRQYGWKNEQLEELWEDLSNAYETKQKCYFLGSIVVVSNQELKIYEEIIDGQQRLTTLMILLNVLAKNFSDINENRTFSEDEEYVTQNVILSKIRTGNGKERLRLQSYKDYDSIFKETIIQQEDFSQITTFPTQKELKSDVPLYKYINTAKFFYEKLKHMEENERGDFINFIFYHVYLIKITCTDQSFAIKLFQVINDRGMNLRSSDIIKAYLMDQLNNSELDQIQKDSFECDWKTIEDNVTSAETEIDEFFTFYEYYQLKANPKTQLIDEMKQIIQTQDIEQIIQELVTFSKCLKNIQQEKNTKIYSLKYIPWSRYVYTILITIEMVNYPQKEELLVSLRRFFYIAFVAGLTLNQIKQTSFTIIADIANQVELAQIENKLQQFITSKKLISKFFNQLNSPNVYGEKWLKPLLITLDYEVRDPSNTTEIVIDKKLNVDHILPQAFDKEIEWSHITKEEGELYKNTFGNMALLSETKNKAILNKGFIKKLQRYQGKDEQGKNIDGFVPFQTTIEIITNYHKNKELWDSKQIEERKEYLMGIVKNKLKIKELKREEISEDEQTYYYLESTNANAKAYIDEQGNTTVKTGTQISNLVASSLSIQAKEKRKELLLNGIINEELIFVNDYTFSSPSAASSFILGYSSSGTISWKNKDGKTLKQVLEQ